MNINEDTQKKKRNTANRGQANSQQQTKKRCICITYIYNKSGLRVQTEEKKRFLLAKTKSDKLKSSSHTLFAAFSKHTNKKKGLHQD